MLKPEYFTNEYFNESYTYLLRSDFACLTGVFTNKNQLSPYFKDLSDIRSGMALTIEFADRILFGTDIGRWEANEKKIGPKHTCVVFVFLKPMSLLKAVSSEESQLKV